MKNTATSLLSTARQLRGELSRATALLADPNSDRELRGYLAVSYALAAAALEFADSGYSSIGTRYGIARNYAAPADAATQLVVALDQILYSSPELDREELGGANFLGRSLARLEFLAAELAAESAAIVEISVGQIGRIGGSY